VKKIILFTMAFALFGCSNETTAEPAGPVDGEPKCKDINLTFDDISCVPGPNCKYGTYATDWLNGACVKAKLGSGRDCDSYRSNYVLTITECSED
jgi:hypothetical protein